MLRTRKGHYKVSLIIITRRRRSRTAGFVGYTHYINIYAASILSAVGTILANSAITLFKEMNIVYFSKFKQTTPYVF